MKESNESFRENGEFRIQIRKKNKYFKFKMLLKLICFILVAGISGAITSKLVIDKKFNEYYTKIISNRSTSVSKETLDNEFSSTINKVAPSVVTISDDLANLSKNNRSKRNTSGIVMNNDGYIVTNYSKIKDFKDIYVKLPAIASEPIKARFVDSEEKLDVAVIKIEYSDLTPIQMSQNDNFREGDIVIAIGNAIADDFVGIAMPGIITSTNDTIELGEDSKKYRVLQTSAKVDSENTGALLCNIKGEFVGMTSEKITKEFAKDGGYYAVGSKAIKEIMQRIADATDILGINGGSVINDDEKGIHGIYVYSVDPDGYAAKSGIKPTDIIVKVNGNNITTLEDIYYEIKDKESGEQVECDILRDGSEMKIFIQL